MTSTARMAAALLALTAWSGIVVQFVITHSLLASIPATLWSLLWYFTITTNILVAIVFTGVAANRSFFSTSSLLTATTLFILLVGIIYSLLLRGLVELSGGSAVADFLLHTATPILTPIFWLAFVPKGQLSYHDPLHWSLYPLGYLIYALVRGEFTHRYPYPFINVDQLGWTRTLLNAVLIGIGFFVVSWLFIALDRTLGRISSRSQAAA